MTLVERVEQGLTTAEDAIRVAELIGLIGWARDLGSEDQPLSAGWLIAAQSVLAEVE